MPTILIDRVDFGELLGTTVDEKLLKEQLDLVKGEYKGEDQDGRLRVELNDTNRPDLWSVEGIARQLRMAQGRRRDYPFFSGGAPSEIIVDAAMRQVRPYVGAFIVRGVRVTDTSLRQIIQTQEKLAENFGRRRRDVAIGVYNLQKITFPIHYRAQDPRTHRYTPLGFEEPTLLCEILARHPKGQEYGHLVAGKEFVPLLVDKAGLTLSMPPIINSREVGEVVPGDSDLFVEATGTDLTALVLSLNIMACDLADRGGRVERVKTVYPYETALGHEVEIPQRLDRGIRIPLSEFGRILGVEVRAGEIDNVLERYGCDVHLENGQVTVQPPPTRADYLHAVDVVEDFAMARGFETFPPQMPRDFSIGRSDPVAVLEDKVRDAMVGMGYEELVGNILVSRAQLTDKMGIPDKPVVEVGNVMNENYAVLRDAVLPSLLCAEARSATAAYPHRLCESGDVAVFDAKAPIGSRTEIHLAGLIAHRDVTLSEIHADLEYLFFQLGLELKLREAEHPSFLPGRAAQVLLADRVVGVLGEVHPAVLTVFEIQTPCAALEINLSALLVGEPEV